MIEALMVQNIPANAVRDIFVDADTGESQVRFIDRPSRVSIAILADAVGVELTILAGNRTVVARSTLDSSGTLGQFPNLDQKAIAFFAAGGEILRGRLREIAGVATTDVMATVQAEPL